MGLPVGAVHAAAGAGDYPSRPIRMVAGWPAGGGSDLIARVVCNQLSVELGQQVVVDNRAGAGNTIASDIVTKAPPNGYTLQFVNANHTLNPFVYGNLPYDTERDFIPISQVSRSALVLVVNGGSPIGSMKELMSIAAQKPGSLSAGTSGTAGSSAVTTDLFKRVSGLDYVIVPYKGGGPAMLALMSGEIQFAIATQATAMGFIKNGKLKPLGVSTEKRLPYMPGVPTFLEHGLQGLDLGPWEGIIAPAKTPQAVIDKVHAAVVRALKAPELLASYAAQGIDPVGSTPAEFAAHVRKQLETFKATFKGRKIGQL
jgi:tripartite-type tricarboxylate transporter receptor subunit TctC